QRQLNAPLLSPFSHLHFAVGLRTSLISKNYCYPSVQVWDVMMDWRVLLVVLCLIEGCALQSTTSVASASQTANTNTGSPVSGSLPTPVSGSQPTPPVSGSPPTPVSGSQPTPPVSGSPPTPVSGSQPTPPVRETPPTPVSGSQPTPPVSGSQPTPPVSGSQPTPSVSGSQPTRPVSGSQPTPPVSGSQPTPPVSGSQPTPPVSGSQPTPVSGSQPTTPASGTQPSSPVSGSQPAPVSGSQPTPAVSGSQPAAPGSGSQSTPSGSGITTVAAAASNPYFSLSFSSPETYTSDLQNSASPAFINRAQKVRDALEPMFRSKFRFFLRLIILAFRSGSIVTDTQVVFNTTEGLPSSANVSAVVVEAASNSSLGLNITASSVNVSAAVIPSSATTASSGSATSSTNAASSSASATTKATANATTANATTANATTANATTANTTTATASTTPPVSGSQPTPPVSGSQPTPISGSQPTSPASGTWPSSPVSGSQPAPVSGSQPTPAVSGSQPAAPGSGSQSTPSGSGITTAAAAASNPYFSLSFSSPETYNSDLQNSASPAFINRAQKVRDALEPMFRSKFRFFLRLIILAFRSGSIVTDTQVVFNTTEGLPSSANVSAVVVEAASNSSLGLNITASSVNVSAAVIPSSATTASSGSATSSTNAASSSASATTKATANATTANATTANATTANATTANTTTATASTTTTATPTAKSFNLTFSINQTFDPKLSQSSSAEFIALSANITAQLEPFFKKLLKNFLRMIIWRFRSGSIVTDSTLNFSSTDINASDVTSAVRTAIVNGNLSFVIDPNSITVTVNSDVKLVVEELRTAVLDCTDCDPDVEGLVTGVVAPVAAVDPGPVVELPGATGFRIGVDAADIFVEPTVAPFLDVGIIVAMELPGGVRGAVAEIPDWLVTVWFCVAGGELVEPTVVAAEPVVKALEINVALTEPVVVGELPAVPAVAEVPGLLAPIRPPGGAGAGEEPAETTEVGAEPVVEAMDCKVVFAELPATVAVVFPGTVVEIPELLVTDWLCVAEDEFVAPK
ncbi:hypothetical protein NFI96_025470, partial [Prochilodus magdalenae]